MISIIVSSINTKKIKITVLEIMVFLAAFIAINSVYSSNSELYLKALCWINNLTFVFELIVFWKLKLLQKPVGIFNICVFLFTSGQCLLYSLNIDIVSFNVFQRVALNDMQEAVKFATLAYIVLTYGMLMGYGGFSLKKKIHILPVKECDNIFETRALNWGIIFIAIGFIPFLIVTYNQLSVFFITGYESYYDSATRVSNVIAFFEYYLFVGLYIFAVVAKGVPKTIAKIALSFLIVVYFLAGDRGSAISILLSLWIIYDYNKSQPQKRSRKSILMLIAVFLICLVAISFVDNWRKLSSTGIGFSELLQLSFKDNILVSSLSTLGGTIYSLANTIKLVPSNYSFIYGGSYLASFLLLIPSFFRIGFLGDISNNLIISSPASWLMGALAITYGPGFTPFAESYLNFGYLGIALIFPIGYCFSKLISGKYFLESDKLSFAFQALAFFLFLMASRGSFNYIVAFWVRYLLIPNLCIKYVPIGKPIIK